MSDSRSSNAETLNKLCEQILSLCDDTNNSRSGGRVESTAKASLAKLLEDLKSMKVETDKKKEGSKSRPSTVKKPFLPPLNLSRKCFGMNLNASLILCFRL